MSNTALMNQFYKRREDTGRKPREREHFRFAVNYRLTPEGTTQVRKFKRDCQAMAFMDYLTDIEGVPDDLITVEDIS